MMFVKIKSLVEYLESKKCFILNLREYKYILVERLIIINLKFIINIAIQLKYVINFILNKN